MAESCEPRVCSGPVSRRNFLRIGALGLGALGGGLRTDLGRLLAAESLYTGAERDF